jgi:hypothetical protein
MATWPMLYATVNSKLREISLFETSFRFGFQPAADEFRIGKLSSSGACDKLSVAKLFQDFGLRICVDEGQLVGKVNLSLVDLDSKREA